MKSITVVLFFLTLYSFAQSQNQLDSLVNREKNIDQTKEHLIYDYRLPDWGYKQFYFDFSGNLSGRFQSVKSNSNENTAVNAQYTPYFIKYNESEESISSFESSLRTSYNHSFSKSRENPLLRKSTRNRFSIDLDFEGAFSRFLNDNWFLYGRADNRLLFLEDHERSTYIDSGNNDTERGITILRRIELSGRIGLGFGKVRNVTPMFQALRFSERLKDLKMQNEGNTNLEELAAFFSQRSGYSQVYDRSNKYFYNDLPQGIKRLLDNAEPWEILYLDDTWNEIIGNRFEGSDINGGISFDYVKYDYNGPYMRELFLLGLYLEHRYYHNLNSFYQIGTNFYSSFSKAVNENTPNDYFGKGKLQIENLWNLTDKLLAELDLGLESAFVSEKKWQRQDRYFLDIIFRYFLENNLSANLSVSYDMYNNWPEYLSFDYDDRHYSNGIFKKENYWNIHISLRYFLERGLF